MTHRPETRIEYQNPELTLAIQVALGRQVHQFKGHLEKVSKLMRLCTDRIARNEKVLVESFATPQIFPALKIYYSVLHMQCIEHLFLDVVFKAPPKPHPPKYSIHFPGGDPAELHANDYG